MAELSTKIPRFLLQILLHVANIINCLIDIPLLPSLSHKITLFHLYKLRMNNLFCYFNIVGYFLLEVDGKSLCLPQFLTEQFSPTDNFTHPKTLGTTHFPGLSIIPGFFNTKNTQAFDPPCPSTSEVRHL